MLYRRKEGEAHGMRFALHLFSVLQFPPTTYPPFHPTLATTHVESFYANLVRCQAVLVLHRCMGEDLAAVWALLHLRKHLLVKGAIGIPDRKVPHYPAGAGAGSMGTIRQLYFCLRNSQSGMRLFLPIRQL